MLNIDSDLGRHLALGQYILDTGRIPSHDLLSHTLAGQSRPPYEWLTQSIFALAYRYAGLDGVVLLVGIIIAAAFTFNYTQAVNRSNLPLLSMAVAILAAAAASSHWLPRPHVVTFLFLTLWLNDLERARRREIVPLWKFALMMILWANLHGGFIFGFLTWSAYFAGAGWESLSRLRSGTLRWSHEKAHSPIIHPLTVRPSSTVNAPQPLGALRLYAKIGSISLAASFLTPAGWENWKAILNNSSQHILSQTVETMPADFGQPWTWPLLALLLLVTSVFLLEWKRVPASHLFLSGGLGCASLLMGRNIPLFALAATPIIAERLAVRIAPRKTFHKIEAGILTLQQSLRGFLWPALLSFGLVLMVGVRQMAGDAPLLHFSPFTFPVQATDWLNGHAQPGEMFNEINWGGYLLYRSWPPQRVFIDSQTDFYGETLVREYERVITASQGWEITLTKYNATWIIIPRTTALSKMMRGSPNWKIVYEDETTLIADRVR
jgi:hypothetical protein